MRASVATFAYNLRFPGQYYMAETGLNQNYFRDYDPAVGRYVESDLIGLAGGVNTYAYVGGNPIAWFDPFGLVDLNYFPSDQNIYNYANAALSPPGTYTVGAHGSPTSLVNAAGKLIM